TWFTGLAAANSLLLGAIFFALALFGFSSWRAEVLGSMARELPFVLILSSICLAQAGRLPTRSQAAAFEEVERRPRLRTVLIAAPAVQLCSWFSAGVAQMIWPIPALSSFAPAPPRFLVITWLSMLPEAFYTGLAAWLFLKAAGPNAPAVRLRLKNLSFSVGTFAWLFMTLNASVHAAVRVLLPDRTREEVTAAQLGLENLLLVTSAVAYGFGLALRYAPTINEALVRRVYPTLLRSQDRLESYKWHLVTGGKVRKTIRISHYAAEAADQQGLSEEDTEKMLTTIQLIAIMKDTSSQTREITPKGARELYELQREFMRDEALASKVNWVKHWHQDNSELENIRSAPLHDALEAALDLTGHPTNSDGAVADTPRALWHHLAALSAADAELLVAERVQEKLGDQVAYHRALNAYNAAKKSAQVSTVNE
ncbi:MAG: hypothetical protein M3N00_00640, partial [Actinomycetota bacterium]|nr:hypothetical protein [Actinomycetota bacterium]